MADNFNILDTPDTGGGLFSESYNSGEQTITSAAQLILAHGLSGVPKINAVTLICKIAELNYTVGDVVEVNPAINNVASGSRGLSVVTDATNITIRYGASSSAIKIIDKTTGNSLNITNGNWRLIVDAFF